MNKKIYLPTLNVIRLDRIANDPWYRVTNHIDIIKKLVGVPVLTYIQLTALVQLGVKIKITGFQDAQKTDDPARLLSQI